MPLLPRLYASCRLSSLMGAADVYGRKTEEDAAEDGQADAESAAPAEVRHACGAPSGLRARACKSRQGASEHTKKKRGKRRVAAF